MFAPLVHMLAVASHAGVPAGLNWYPWQTNDRQYHGWRIEPHGEGEPMFLYFVPDLDAEGLRASVYCGFHGDPERDDLVTVVGGPS